MHLIGAPSATTAVKGERPARPLHVVTEEIIAPHEQLPPAWAGDATTGHRYAIVVNGIFIDDAARSRLART